MAHSRQIKLDFFRIRQQGEPEFSLASCGLGIMARPTATDRNWEREGDYIRFLAFEKHQFAEYFCGVIVRIRPNDVALVCSVDTDMLEELELDEKQHLADVMHFIYVPSHDVVVAERNRNVGTGHMICDYLSHILGLKHLECEFFADTKAADKWKQMRSVTSVAVKLIYDREAFKFEDANLPLDHIADLAEQFGAYEFMMQFSVGRKKKWLKDPVKDMVDRVLGWEGRIRPRAVIVRGSDEASTSYLLNLTKRKFDLSESVQWEEDPLPAHRIWAALYNGFQKIKAQLEEIGGMG